MNPGFQYSVWQTLHPVTRVLVGTIFIPITVSFLSLSSPSTFLSFSFFIPCPLPFPFSVLPFPTFFQIPIPPLPLLSFPLLPLLFLQQWGYTHAVGILAARRCLGFLAFFGVTVTWPLGFLELGPLSAESVAH